ANRKLEEGISVYANDNYLSKLKAAKSFADSLSFSFKDNKALGFLILSYAEVFPDASNASNASKNIYKLIQLGKSSSLSDLNVALGTVIFYINNTKYKTAI